jgi:hypothetical protein
MMPEYLLPTPKNVDIDQLAGELGYPVPGHGLTAYLDPLGTTIKVVAHLSWQTGVQDPSGAGLGTVVEHSIVVTQDQLQAVIDAHISLT